MYKIVGADQKEYGPVSEEQMRQWIADGRANGQTIARFADGPWKPLSTFPEFAASLGATSPPLATPPPLTLRGSSSTAAETNGLAIAGLICGILGLFCCGPILSTLALVCSVLALSQINQNPGRYAGKGLAVAGLVLAMLGYCLFAVLIFTGLFRRLVREFPRHF